MNISFEIPLPWDTLVAATIQVLPGYAPGVVLIRHEIISPGGLSIFHLSNTEVGSLGKITLRKVGEKTTMLSVDEPPNEPQKELQSITLTAYLNRLVHDVSLWTSNNTYPPGFLIGFADINPDTADNFGKYFGDFIRAALDADKIKGETNWKKPEDNPITYRKKGGAKPDLVYDESYTEISSGATLDQAYENYLKRLGIRHEKLEKDKFRSAMVRRGYKHK